MPVRTAPKKKKPARKKSVAIPLPQPGDWRSTDEVEVLRRIQRAREEKHAISNLDPAQVIHSSFSVKSPSGMSYQVEIRNLSTRAFSCTCPDYRTAGLGTCKHIEATLIWLKRRHKAEYLLAVKRPAPQRFVVPDGDGLKLEPLGAAVPTGLLQFFDAAGMLIGDPDECLPKLRRSGKVRISQDVEPFLEARRRADERRSSRRDYDTGVVEGSHPEHVTLHPLYPYQRGG